jgi:dihydrofolate synthase/folylpolyglutamate synthase
MHKSATKCDRMTMARRARSHFQTFEDAFRYITQFTNYERMTDFPYRKDVLDLDRVRTVLHALGNPQKRYPIVHVAGTKGKGSVCALVASVLQSAGHRVGLFSKPHLIRLNERISINGCDISDEDFVQMMNRLHPHLEDQRSLANPLTFFDLITVLALAYFAHGKSDLVVLEVGLGGRLDSTNVVSSTISVITSIDYDHTHILGETLEKIAAEKAGIIKPKTPVISGVTDPGPASVIEEIARERHAPLFVLGQDFQCESRDESGAFFVQTWRRRSDALRIPLWGEHQRRNAAIAIATLDALDERLRLGLTGDELRAGLAKVRLRGRIEVVSQNPIVVLDVAHNPVSLRALRETLTDRCPNRRIVLLLGMAQDKDVRGSLREVLPIASSAVFTGIGHPRGVNPEELQRLAKEISPKLPCEAEPEIEKALERARELTQPEDVLCITGSFYLAGAVASRVYQPT